MAEILRPDGDLNTTWTCSTGTSRYALIDEATLATSDYIYTSTKSAEQYLTLTNPTTFPGSGQMTITLNAKGSTTTKIYARLLQGSTVLFDGSTAQATLTTSYSNYTWTFTPNVSVTDWTDLRLWIRNGTVTGTTYCAQAYVTVPDPAYNPLSGLEMGMMF